MNTVNAGIVIAISGLLLSLALLLSSGRSTPFVLLILFVGWVSLPYAILLLCYAYSARWSELERKALFVLTVIISAGSLAVYLLVTISPLSSTPARPWLIVPAVSIVIIAVTMLNKRFRKVGNV